ncbi:hypothetical protein E2C01_057470 [Portunus trituberculatus]|uniref:Uncharacterized protein n=1 Tax=Portunus trituberculatus TaxID=210409 RepID=A0A5B7GWW2_PORTR|nr:hypothetical protein [Portunus trituberculatus]
MYYSQKLTDYSWKRLIQACDSSSELYFPDLLVIRFPCRLPVRKRSRLSACMANRAPHLLYPHGGLDMQRAASSSGYTLS